MKRYVSIIEFDSLALSVRCRSLRFQRTRLHSDGATWTLTDDKSWRPQWGSHLVHRSHWSLPMRDQPSLMNLTSNGARNDKTQCRSQQVRPGTCGNARKQPCCEYFFLFITGTDRHATAVPREEESMPSSFILISFLRKIRPLALCSRFRFTILGSMQPTSDT
jgi:hypothetical protein